MRKLLLLLAWGGSLAEMVKSRLATQTTRPVFEQGFADPRRYCVCDH